MQINDIICSLKKTLISKKKIVINNLITTERKIIQASNYLLKQPTSK